MEHKVTRQHRVAAVAAMYPDCKPDSPMWRDFVEAGDAQSYRTLSQVAQMLAGTELSEVEHERSEVNAEAMTWLRINGGALLAGGGDLSVDAADALCHVLVRDADTQVLEGTLKR